MSEFIPSGGGQTGFRAGIQKVGGNLAGMVIPNIGAFIAWGLLTALFIPTGWLPNEDFSSMVGPMILNLLPILIGYTGGRIVHGQRGAVIGSIATVGVIVGTDIPMFLGAMIIGPLMAWILKYIDKYLTPSPLPALKCLSATSRWVLLECSAPCWVTWALAPLFPDHHFPRKWRGMARR